MSLLNFHDDDDSHDEESKALLVSSLGGMVPVHPFPFPWIGNAPGYAQGRGPSQTHEPLFNIPDTQQSISPIFQPHRATRQDPFGALFWPVQYIAPQNRTWMTAEAVKHIFRGLETYRTNGQPFELFERADDMLEKSSRSDVGFKQDGGLGCSDELLQQIDDFAIGLMELWHHPKSAYEILVSYSRVFQPSTPHHMDTLRKIWNSVPNMLKPKLAHDLMVHGSRPPRTMGVTLTVNLRFQSYDASVPRPDAVSAGNIVTVDAPGSSNTLYLVLYTSMATRPRGGPKTWHAHHVVGQPLQVQVVSRLGKSWDPIDHAMQLAAVRRPPHHTTPHHWHHWHTRPGRALPTEYFNFSYYLS
ncbi:hypothetical protein BJ170DRAFT_591759 [Xylariales sp. AK1849]|nr:hypothetical protein BJ170DRAFT_591759 [Xylariales sp. AK1849]